MSIKQQYLLFSALYLLSFVVFAGWFVLLFIGFLSSEIMAIANRIAVPTLIGSVLSLELFRRLVRRAERKLS